MSNPKVGRNAPCPCGSGKKFKRCCLRKQQIVVSTPPRHAKVIDYHFVERNGVWQKKPGRIKATVLYKTEVDIDTSIEGLFKPVFSRLADVNCPNLEDGLHDCKHKLYAIRWHERSVRKAIQGEIDELRDQLPRISGITSERLNQAIINLTEDFLFQVVSSIEILTKALHYVVPCLQTQRQGRGNDRTNFLEGKRLLAKLAESGEEGLANHFRSVWDEWLHELTEMRNTVTHRSALDGFECVRVDPYDGQKIIIRPPEMPSGQPVQDYCEEILENTLNLHQYVFDDILRRM